MDHVRHLQGWRLGHNRRMRRLLHAARRLRRRRRRSRLHHHRVAVRRSDRLALRDRQCRGYSRCHGGHGRRTPLAMADARRRARRHQRRECRQRLVFEPRQTGHRRLFAECRRQGDRHRHGRPGYNRDDARLRAEHRRYGRTDIYSPGLHLRKRRSFALSMPRLRMGRFGRKFRLWRKHFRYRGCPQRHDVHMALGNDGALPRRARWRALHHRIRRAGRERTWLV